MYDVIWVKNLNNLIDKYMKNLKIFLKTMICNYFKLYKQIISKNVNKFQKKKKG